MVFGIIGSLELSSLVPGSWRLSTSLVLQTTALALVLYVIFKVVSLIVRGRRVQRDFGDYPGPKETHWLFGSFYYFPKDFSKWIYHFLDLSEKYATNGYYRLWRPFQARPVIVICGPSAMKAILKTAEPKLLDFSGPYRMLMPWLGEGLLISGGGKWARNRRLLTPAFHFDVLKPYVNVYNKAADILFEKLDSFAQEEKKFEVFQEVCACTLDIILKCAFSYDVDVQRQGERSPYVRAVTDLSNSLVYRMRRPYLHFDLLWNLSPTGRQSKRDSDFVHSVAEDIINKRRMTLEKSGSVTDRKYLDFLDILLTARDEAGIGLSQKEIRNEVDTFLFEGHDTTASGISWILYSLAQHPEYQQKCQAEIDQILQDRDTDDIHWDDISKLEYLTMCVKEGLRLHCPVPIVNRHLTKELNMGDRILPKGTAIQINIWALHHNKRHWDKDMEYIPERFSKENLSKIDHYQFVPFSAGPRNCIGQHFAMNEEKVVLAKLLRNFTFKLDPNHLVKRRVAAVMRAEDGIMMYVTRRNHK